MRLPGIWWTGQWNSELLTACLLLVFDGCQGFFIDKFFGVFEKVKILVEMQAERIIALAAGPAT